MSDSVTATAEELSPEARFELRLFLRHLPPMIPCSPGLDELEEHGLVRRRATYRVHHMESDRDRALATYLLSDFGFQVACVVDGEISPQEEISPGRPQAVIPTDPETVGNLMLAVAIMATELERDCANQRFRRILEGPAVAASIKTARAQLGDALGGDLRVLCPSCRAPGLQRSGEFWFCRACQHLFLSPDDPAPIKFRPPEDAAPIK